MTSDPSSTSLTMPASSSQPAVGWTASWRSPCSSSRRMSSRGSKPKRFTPSRSADRISWSRGIGSASKLSTTSCSRRSRTRSSWARRRRTIAQRRRDAAQLVTNQDTLERIEHAPRRYVLATAPDDLARQVLLCDPMPRPTTVRVEVTPGANGWTVDVVARDRPGLLAERRACSSTMDSMSYRPSPPLGAMAVRWRRSRSTARLRRTATGSSTTLRQRFETPSPRALSGA